MMMMEDVTDLILTRQQRALTRASPSPEDNKVTCHSLSCRRKGASSLASVSDSTFYILIDTY